MPTEKWEKVLLLCLTPLLQMSVAAVINRVKGSLVIMSPMILPNFTLYSADCAASVSNQFLLKRSDECTLLSLFTESDNPRLHQCECHAVLQHSVTPHCEINVTQVPCS